MTAYIEFVIIDNLVITTLIGAASYRFLRVKISVLRLTIASVLGTVAAVVFPFINVVAIVQFLLKMSLGAAISAVLFVKKHNYWRGAAAFMIITFMFGGLLFCLGLMVHGSVTDALAKPLSPLPVGMILGAPVLLYLIFRKLFLRFHRVNDARANVMDIKIELGGFHVEAKGFLDTGNRLYDIKTGLPVIILSFKAILPLLEDSQLGILLNGEAEKLFADASPHYMPFASLGCGDGKILVVKPKKFSFYYKDKVNILYDVMVGLSFNKITDCVEYNAILHPGILENIS